MALRSPLACRLMSGQRLAQGFEALHDPLIDDSASMCRRASSPISLVSAPAGDPELMRTHGTVPM